MPETEQQPPSAGGGEGTALERVLNRYMGNVIHVFLSVLATLLMVAAGIAVIETAYREFPRLWFAANPYDALHLLLQQILLIAIAAELALLLLFHRTSAAVEVVMMETNTIVLRCGQRIECGTRTRPAIVPAPAPIRAALLLC